MGRWILALFALFGLFGLVFAWPGAAEELDLSKLSNQKIIATAPELHPSALYVLAARLLAQGKGQEAANWMYAGQLRYRILIATAKQAASGNDRALFGALTEQVGRPVNEYIAGDPDEWIAAINWALEWDDTNPNGLVDKTEHAAIISEIRKNLTKFRDDIDGRRDEIARERSKNGLKNR